MDVDLSADVLRHVVQIWLVATGHDDVRETSAVGCKRLAAPIHPSTCVASPKWPRADDLFEPCACALQRTGVDLGYVTEQRRFAGAGRRRNYDDSACHSAIERIQKSAAIGFRRVAPVPQSEPSSAATTTLSAVDLFCTASLVLARAYSARTAGHGTLRRQAAYAGSVGVENELFVDITVLQ